MAWWRELDPRIGDAPILHVWVARRWHCCVPCDVIASNRAESSADTLRWRLVARQGQVAGITA